MNIFKLSWKNLTHKPGSMILSLILFALGVGLISFLLLLNSQLQDKFEKNLGGIDLVVGAKGSPLQLILNSMYHIDAPTGNIQLKDAKPFFNPKNPLIDQAVPLSLGDSYKTYRIAGTTHEFLSLYNAEIEKGEKWSDHFEVTLGATVADKLGLDIGDTFKSTHGFIADDQMEHDHEDDFKVVGILKPTGAVIDQLILTSNATYWHVHAPAGEEEHAHEDHEDHEGHDHSEHEGGHDHDHEHDGEANEIYTESEDLIAAEDDKEITSMLLTFKGRSYQSLNLARNINENTDMQAASPAIEINRLFSLMDTGSKMLNILAIAIIIVSGLSVFISLYSKMRARRYELAFMRVKGATRNQLFILIVLEGVIIAVMGTLIGLILAHASMYFLAGSMEENYRYTFSAFEFLFSEIWVVLAAIAIGIVASIIPALQAARTDISKTLAG